MATDRGTYFQYPSRGRNFYRSFPGRLSPPRHSSGSPLFSLSRFRYLFLSFLTPSPDSPLPHAPVRPPPPPPASSRDYILFSIHCAVSCTDTSFFHRRVIQAFDAAATKLFTSFRERMKARNDGDVYLHVYTSVCTYIKLSSSLCLSAFLLLSRIYIQSARNVRASHTRHPSFRRFRYSLVPAGRGDD